MRTEKFGRWVWPFSVAVLLLLVHLLPAPDNGTIMGLPAFCPLKAVSGVPCPGCGMTRALILSAHGQWKEAAVFHPLSPVLYAALWIGLLAGLWNAVSPQPANAKPAGLSARAKVLRKAVMVGASTFVSVMAIIWLMRLSGFLPWPPNF